MPYNCQNMVVDADKKTDDDKLSQIRNSLGIYSYNYYPTLPDYVNYDKSEIHPICAQIESNLDILS